MPRRRHEPTLSDQANPLEDTLVLAPHDPFEHEDDGYVGDDGYEDRDGYEDEDATGGFGLDPIDLGPVPVVGGVAARGALPDGSGVGPRHGRRRRSIPKKILGGVAILVGLVVLGAGAGYALDASNEDGRVARGVHLGGRPVGGMHRDALTAEVHGLAATYLKAPVTITVDGTPILTDASALGLTLDERATVNATLAERKGAIPSRFTDWVRSYLGDAAEAPVVLAVDRTVLDRAAVTLDTGRVKPTEPGITLDGERFVSVPGQAGSGIDPEALTRALLAAGGQGAQKLSVALGRTPVKPRLSLADADALAAEATQRTAKALPIAAGTATASLTPAVLRPLVHSAVVEATASSPAALRLVLDPKGTADAVAKALIRAGKPAQEPTFSVQGSLGSKLVPGTLPGQVMAGVAPGITFGQVVAQPGADGTVCCDETAAGLVQSAFLTRDPAKDTRPVTLALTISHPTISDAGVVALGVMEPIGSFTTRHPAGQSRVTNIHRIADTVRGTLILPGQTLSINTLVGPRTAAKGYVDAPVIENGLHATDIGGGVSQFATTMFNASFFGGLDLINHQSHSLVISRYPYGRDATLGLPAPDLVVRNPSDKFAVLVWTSYTADSVTVTLYSTVFAVGVQTAMTQAPSGPCTRVTTTRTRTFTDGRTVVDKIPSLYRPSEGVNCP